MSTLTPIRPERPLYWPDIINELQAALADLEVYLVGGTVRDAYMGRPIHDLDLALALDGRPVARRLANHFNGDYYPLDDARGVGRALIAYQSQALTIDVARFRGVSLAADLRDRDFTLNAMAVRLDDLHHILDPLDGLDAIRHKQIRLCQPEAIADDPVRALRAIRQSLALNMRLTPPTVQALKRDGPRLKRCSPERIRDELFKLLAIPKATAGLNTLDRLGLLALLFSEIEDLKGLEQPAPHIYDGWQHTLNVLDFTEKVLTTISPRRTDNTASNLGLGMIAYGLAGVREQLQAHLAHAWPNGRTHRGLLVLAALAHDIAKPATATQDEDSHRHFYGHAQLGAEWMDDWGQRLRLSNEETKRLSAIVRHHMRPLHLFNSFNGETLSRRAVYRFWRDTGQAGVDVCLLSLADFLGTYGPRLDQDAWLRFVEVIQQLLAAYYTQHEELVSFTPLVDGNTLLAHFDLSPGPLIGQALEAVREAQAAGEVDSQEAALRWLADWLTQRTPHSPESPPD